VPSNHVVKEAAANNSKMEKTGNSASIVFAKSPITRKPPILSHDNKENTHQTESQIKPVPSTRSLLSHPLPQTEGGAVNNHLQKIPERSSMPFSTRSVFRNIRKPVSNLEPASLESGLLGFPGLDDRTTIQPMKSVSSPEPEKALNERFQSNFDSVGILEHHLSDETANRNASLPEKTQIVGRRGDRIWKREMFMGNRI
jgi:hypothetical protein